MGEGIGTVGAEGNLVAALARLGGEVGLAGSDAFTEIVHRRVMIVGGSDLFRQGFATSHALFEQEELGDGIGGHSTVGHRGGPAEAVINGKGSQVHCRG